MSEPLPIAVLISGGGTTLKNLIDCRSRNELDVSFRLVIGSRQDAGGLSYARQEGIPIRIVTKSKMLTAEEHSQSIFEPIRASGAKLVVMGGFLQHVLIPTDFESRVINIHPSLIPSFCGRGMYGLRVHQAVLEFGAKVTGCTVHYVDNQYDHGPILLQRCCEVLDGDTPESLQQRVFRVECEAYPAAIRKIVERLSQSFS